MATEELKKKVWEILQRIDYTNPLIPQSWNDGLEFELRNLGKVGVEVLLEDVDNSDDAIRFKVLEGLSIIRAPGTAEAMIALLQDVYHTDLQPHMIEAFGDIGDPIAVDYLSCVLAEGLIFARVSRPFFQQAAATALGKIGGEEATGVLIKTLPASEDPLRSTILDALIVIGEPAVKQLMEKISGLDSSSIWISILSLTLLKIDGKEISDKYGAGLLKNLNRGHMEQLTKVRPSIIDAYIKNLADDEPRELFGSVLHCLEVLANNGVYIDPKKLQITFEKYIENQSIKGKEAGKKAIRDCGRHYGKILSKIRELGKRGKGTLSEGKLQPPKGSKRLVRVRRIRNG